MRLSVRSQPIVKSVCYSILSLVALVFSAAFFPSLGIAKAVPYLTVAVISALAMFEGVKFASFTAVILGGIEAFVYGKNSLVYILFYTAFAFLCITLFSSFFTKNFFSWLLYTFGGIILHAALGLFGPVSDWGVTALDLLQTGALDSIFLSLIFSLPIFPIVAKIKKKTE